MNIFNQGKFDSFCAPDLNTRALCESGKVQVMRGNTAELTHNTGTDELKITEAKSQKIDQQNGGSGESGVSSHVTGSRRKIKLCAV